MPDQVVGLIIQSGEKLKEGWFDRLETDDLTLAHEDKTNRDGIAYLRRIMA